MARHRWTWPPPKTRSTATTAGRDASAAAARRRCQRERSMDASSGAGIGAREQWPFHVAVGEGARSLEPLHAWAERDGAAKVARWPADGVLRCSRIRPMHGQRPKGLIQDASRPG